MQVKRNESRRKVPTGISERHSRRCLLSIGGDRCDCEPSYRAFVYDRRTHEIVRKTFSGHGALAAAKLWRADALSALGKGKNVTPSKRTLQQAADEWLACANAEPPTILNRSGRPYKPSVLRCYEADLNTYVLPDLGALRLSDVRRSDLQALVDRLVGQGLSGSKVRNVIIPVRVLFRQALEREEVSINPTTGLRLPNGVGRRNRAASPSEASELLAALPEGLQPIYATAFYGGLRRGELRGLRWDDVDLARGLIHVRRGWDDYAGEVLPKSAKGERQVPIAAILRDYLAEHKTRTGRGGEEFVFGSAPDRPFTPNHLRRKAAKAWADENEKRAEKKRSLLAPIGLHEARHTYVSIMFEAGLSLERIGDYVGHSSTYMTDRYRHLLKGHEAEAARMLDEYLARADSRPRIEQLESDAGGDA